ncbi:hypothetical protein [Parasulfitobacter algicola]|uniref:Ribbon-helix-helix protein CopG domain-containing protein n=1 Tax=Parasulfitobacter algicola TaxID=2614809 RepID=A0ABX2IW80_9RHOB|nr:hypothetical protein [Sulfitobacter algicola]NSX56805.1 hypothetical protein [Sulfitobacter algicola]
MTDRKKLVKTYVSPETAALLRNAAKAQGLSESSFVRILIETIVEEDGTEAVQPPKVARVSKVTVRLPKDVAGDLNAAAKEQRVTASTWAASILMAKFRAAPQPVKSQRRAIQRSFRQLQGMATNTNQMAALMNRGVFTGDSYAPTRDELAALRKGIADLRTDLRQFAGGQYDLQIVRGLDDE